MTIRRSTSWLFMLPLIALPLSGCGISEEEMQKRLDEVAAARKADQEKAQAEIDAARKQIEDLKNELKSKGVDISNLNADIEQKARALEDYKRRAEQLEAIKKRFELLRQKLQGLTKLGLKVYVRNNRMVIALPGDVLFDSGRETLKKEGEAILGKVAEVIRNDQGLAARAFQVAGHTDNAPLQGGRFKDNWGLSVMRAREVLVYLVTPVSEKGGGGLNPAKWSAAGYGDTDPVKSNDSPEGKQGNRRCELVVLPAIEEMLDLKSLTQ
jgi:chemotaxis protein MotB